jgi:AcrR family transcriptional regulator
VSDARPRHERLDDKPVVAGEAWRYREQHDSEKTVRGHVLGIPRHRPSSKASLAILSRMALPRFAKLPAERRNVLIAAAAVEFAAKGYDGAVLGAIAEKSGIGKSSFYYYFADKEDLFATVLGEAWQRMSAAARLDLATLTAATFWPSLENVARENMALCAREPWLLAGAKLLNRASLDTSGVGVLVEYREKRYAWEVEFISRGQALGAVREDLPAELLATISLSARQASNLWLLDRIELLGEAHIDRLAIQAFDVYRAILVPPGLRVRRETRTAAGAVAGA